MENLFGLIITGLAIGSVYALVAMGFALIYKSTSIINFAQGEFVLVGGYVALWLYTDLRGLAFEALAQARPELFAALSPAGWQLAVVAAAFLLTIVVGLLMVLALERLILRPMIGEPIISVIMVTIALATVLKGLVTLIWETQIRNFDPPIFQQQDGLRLGVITLPGVYLWIFIFAALFLVSFALFFKFTRVGVSMRAVAADQQVAQSMGISVKTVFAISWSIGAVVAVVGGMLVGNINGVNIELSHFGLTVFPAVILGGLESVGGAIIGGLVIGLVQYLGPELVGQAVALYNRAFDAALVAPGNLEAVLPFVVLVAILMVRPYGLFGVKEIERV